MFTAVELVTLPRAVEVVRFLGWPESTPAEAQASVTEAITIAAMAAQGYTRGKGFFDDEVEGALCKPDIAAVITSTAARLASNPTNARRIEVGSFNTAPGLFEGWNLAELAILNGYRKRTA